MTTVSLEVRGFPERKENLLEKGTDVRSQEPELDPATQDSSPLRMGIGPFA